MLELLLWVGFAQLFHYGLRAFILDIQSFRWSLQAEPKSSREVFFCTVEVLNGCWFVWLQLRVTSSLHRCLDHSANVFEDAKMIRCMHWAAACYVELALRRMILFPGMGFGPRCCVGPLALPLEHFPKASAVFIEFLRVFSRKGHRPRVLV